MSFISDKTSIFYSVLFFILFLCNCIFIGGIADQAQYGPRVCLLNVQNYHLDPTYNTYIFDAHSTSCGAAIAIGTISLILGLGVMGLLVYYKWKQQIPSRQMMLITACIATAMSFLMLIIASVVSAGLNATCDQFQRATGNSCETIFWNGFFADNPNVKYQKNLKTVSAAAGAGWVAFLCWSVFATFEWVTYRNEARRWW